MEINRKGCTRIVILTKRYAFKLPNFLEGWRLFLHGLLANDMESEWGKSGYEGICPVLFAIKGGFLVVMPRAVPFTIDEFLTFDYENWIDKGDYIVPAERKPDSFGWLNGQIVAIDYGN